MTNTEYQIILNDLKEQITKVDDPPPYVSRRLPSWFKVHRPGNKHYMSTLQQVKQYQLHTVCQEARCPNIGECFANKVAAFMILGDTCTRRCTFCHVHKGVPKPVDADEPEHIAMAVLKMGMEHIVITAVDRDDLLDGGAEHFSKVVCAVKEKNSTVRIEVLTGDFQGDIESLATVLHSPVDIFNHNLETVPSLYRRIRPGTYYDRSLNLFREAKKIRKDIITKSGLMLGLGETFKELLDVMDDLRIADCDMLTLGQYARPSLRQVPVRRYLHPDEFLMLKKIAYEKGFKHVESGPLVRSSYHAQHQNSQDSN
ncbi:MAG: lipoyl synthase [Chlamydiota bacterium]|nr:lipoyl synthase [Chlamydiota bacterium]